MRRREFITLLAGAAAWPLAARAQQTGAVRRIAVLMGYDENDPDGNAQLARFTKGLPELGWIDGRNLRMDVRWTAGNVDRARAFAKELVDLHPDVLLAHTTPATAALQRETRTIPVVFVTVSDPVGSGFVAGLPRPAGNITGRPKTIPKQRPISQRSCKGWPNWAGLTAATRASTIVGQW